MEEEFVGKRGLDEGVESGGSTQEYTVVAAFADPEGTTLPDGIADLAVVDIIGESWIGIIRAAADIVLSGDSGSDSDNINMGEESSSEHSEKLEDGEGEKS